MVVCVCVVVLFTHQNICNNLSLSTYMGVRLIWMSSFGLLRRKLGCENVLEEVEMMLSSNPYNSNCVAKLSKLLFM